MNVTNCRGCGRLFNQLSNEQLCPNCMKKMDEKFEVVKKFVDDNPNVPVETVAKETETTMKQLNKWIREERLTFAPGSAYGLPCECCGRTIPTGKYCDECKKKLANTLQSVLDKPAPKKEDKRIFADKEKMRYIK